uniref:alanine--tRNA ligase n=1 Tax=Parastrongyloides trichosuri TaxID=131310 RepID=A0A0N4ZQY1_PARTI
MYFLNSNELRKSFIKYFIKNGHKQLPSSSVVPKNDNTLLFTNAGMNQFKSIFLNELSPNDEMRKLKRVVNSQKCVRAGGKHNDLDDVGKDTYHHTFFEMLGNWSFGDYYKKETCTFAWKYLTDELGIDKNRLYVSYFGGDSKLGLDEDLETREIWNNIGVSDSHIVVGNTKDNFWEMGNTGPCGPCSEIHIDRIDGRGNVKHLVNKDDSNVVEIWNLVFMNNNRIDTNIIKPLHGRFIDCGMGFERLLSIIQNKSSSYDTDLFSPIMDEIQRLRENKQPYNGTIGNDKIGIEDMAYRLVSDHIRTISIIISDGVTPGAIDQGFILRKLIRRSVYSMVSKLGCSKFSLNKLVPIVIDSLGESYPELKNNFEKIQIIINKEEENFWNIITKNNKLIRKTIQSVDENIISGEKAWNLYSTHGIPIDVTIEIANDYGKTIDIKEFDEIIKSKRKKGNTLKQSSL